MWVTAVILNYLKKKTFTWKREQRYLNFMNVFTTPQGAFQRCKYIFDLEDANIHKTIFLSPVLPIWTLQSRAQFGRFILENILRHTQGSCPPFMPTLTSWDPEASLKYSLAIFSNPHIHSLWLCWETHSVKAENNLNKSIFRTFASQLQAYRAVFQSPNSPELTHSLTAVVQLVPHAAKLSWQSTGSNPGARGYETHTVHGGLEVLKYNWVTAVSMQVSGFYKNYLKT